VIDGENAGVNNIFFQSTSTDGFSTIPEEEEAAQPTALEEMAQETGTEEAAQGTSEDGGKTETSEKNKDEGKCKINSWIQSVYYDANANP
jgi:hypothetical protein